MDDPDDLYMMDRKIKLIFNPIANLGRAWTIASSLRPIVCELGGADWSGTAFPTHATELAARSADEGYDLVVAMGGDGTMHEVLNGLMQIPAERRPSLGVVPVGSGNDFAYACGLPSKPDEALRLALTGQPKSVDIGVITDNHDHSEYWANAIGIGFDTIVTLNSRKIKIAQGFGAYFLAVLQALLFQYTPFDLKMTIDGKNWERSLLMLCLMNGKREGGGFHVTPDAKPDDGWFDTLGVDRVSRLRLLKILPEVMNGTQARLPDCHMQQFREIEINSDRPLYVHADGEITATPQAHVTKLSIKLIQNALQVVR
jgi:diacylglycerol kinase (ATP)